MTQTHLGGDSSGSAAAGVGSPGRASIPARTLRTDRWWVEPAVTFTLLVAWLLYALIRTASQRYYFVEVPLPLAVLVALPVGLLRSQRRATFGTWFGEFPPFVPLGLLVLPFLLGFRLTCYYYRKAYYRSFWLSPPACAVAEPHGKYTGETRFPLVLQNAHRYFFYAAIVVSLINTYDVIRAFRGKDGGFGIGLGTLIMLVNVVFLWAYTASCHSCRHLIGGRLRHFSKPRRATGCATQCRSSTPVTSGSPGRHSGPSWSRTPTHRAGVGRRHSGSEAGQLTWRSRLRRTRSAVREYDVLVVGAGRAAGRRSPPARPVCGCP